MNNVSYRKQLRISILLITALLSVFAVTDTVSAHHYTLTPDGQGCTWTHIDPDLWLGTCYVPSDEYNGIIQGYNSIEGFWRDLGYYDGTFDYLYAVNGGYMTAFNRTTGETFYYTECGWWTADQLNNQICITGSTFPSWDQGLIDFYQNAGIADWFQDAWIDISRIWLRPECTASYNGC